MDLKQIFDRFNQADTPRAQKYGGTGIGLFLAKRFVELQGGTIEVNSIYGKGSTFTICLPMRNGYNYGQSTWTDSTNGRVVAQKEIELSDIGYDKSRIREEISAGGIIIPDSAMDIPTEGTVVAIGGGCGSAIVFPVARAFKEAGNHLITINGARSMDLLLYRDEMEKISDETFETTDDGSCGVHGFVTNVLADLIAEGRQIDLVFAVGPVPMMKFVAKTTESKKIPTLVSLNSIMVDGTGMCGACRVNVGGQMKFACVDGPEFDGHEVDFDELMGRLNAYKEQETISEKQWVEEHGGAA